MFKKIISFYTISIVLEILDCLFMTPPYESCGKGKYYNPKRKQCLDIINCTALHEVDIKVELSTEGFVKKRYLASIDNTQVVYSYPRSSDVVDDFLRGMKMLLYFQSTGWVVPVVGYCDNEQQQRLLLMYEKYGSAENLDQIFDNMDLDVSSEFEIRSQLAVDYLSIIEILHNFDKNGSYVMCDSNDLQKTLQQFLITENFRLVVLDLDALPQVRFNKSIKCGHRQLYGDFVAPEQLWTDTEKPFSDSEMQGYNEKTDIWKIPDVLIYFLGKSHLSTRTQLFMYELFQLCKNNNPKKRPAINEIKNKFVNTIHKILKIEL